MRFRKFNEFLKEREVEESAAPAIGTPNDKLNRSAFDLDRERVVFNNRFSDPKEGEKVVMLTGRYKSVADFLRDKNPRKWATLKMPGADNWRDGPVDDKMGMQ
jgi:hypothetical protein